MPSQTQVREGCWLELSQSKLPYLHAGIPASSCKRREPPQVPPEQQVPKYAYASTQSPPIPKLATAPLRASYPLGVPSVWVITSFAVHADVQRMSVGAGSVPCRMRRLKHSEALHVSRSIHVIMQRAICPITF